MWRKLAIAASLLMVASPAPAASIDDYRAALTHDPRDVDARAALIDRLIWSGQYDEADRTIDVGLTLSPGSAPLLARRAQLLHFRGDTASGRPYLKRAEALAPHDLDIRTLGDRMWLGEARMRMRRDVFPAGWPSDVTTWELWVLQRVGRAMLGVRTEQSKRPVTPYGDGTYNAFYAASLAYALGVGWTLGVEGGFGQPARAVPNALGRAFLYFPIHGPLDGYAAYTYMTFPSGVSVHLINPAIGLQITDALRIDARYWLANTATEGSRKVVHSIGSYAILRVRPRFAIDALYVYGSQLDRLVPAAFQLGEIRSHIFAGGFDWRVVRELGIKPQYQFEIRRNPNADVIRIHSGELAVYVRW